MRQRRGDTGKVKVGEDDLVAQIPVLEVEWLLYFDDQIAVPRVGCTDQAGAGLGILCIGETGAKPCAFLYPHIVSGFP